MGKFFFSFWNQRLSLLFTRFINVKHYFRLFKEEEQQRLQAIKKEQEELEKLAKLRYI